MPVFWALLACACTCVPAPEGWTQAQPGIQSESAAPSAPGQVQAAAAAQLASPTATRLGTTIDSVLATSQASRAHWGISVVDAATGVTLYARNDAQLFAPASNAKLFTTAAALALLGPAYTIRTTVVAEGQVTPDGHLHGVLRLVGAGDPTMSGRSYPYIGHTVREAPPLHALDELAAQVAASGIHAVDGTVIGDDTLFPWERYGTGWAWDDLEWDYGAPVTALTVADNVTYLAVNPGAQTGDRATANWIAEPAAGSTPTPPPAPAPSSPMPSEMMSPSSADPGEALIVAAHTTAPGTEPHIGISREVDGGPLRVFGTIPAGTIPAGTIPAQGKPVNAAIAIREPADYAARAFVAALSRQGIATSRVSGADHRASNDTASFNLETHQPLTLHPVLPGEPGSAVSAVTGRVVATRISPPLRDIVTVVNKVSQNLHAELLLRILGHAEGDDGSVAQGVRVVRQFLTNAGIDPQDFSFVDGCGLSPQDQVTPRAVTTLLLYASRQSWAADYRASLPIGGVDGSLTNRFTEPSLRGRVLAKTGTLSQVNAISGYLTAASGRPLIFSVISNDYVGEGSRATLDHVVGAITAAY